MKNGQLEKWDAITELGLKDNNTQHSNYYSNFLTKVFILIKYMDLINHHIVIHKVIIR